jgi:hypothetical protein
MLIWFDTKSHESWLFFKNSSQEKKIIILAHHKKGNITYHETLLKVNQQPLAHLEGWWVNKIHHSIEVQFLLNHYG